MAPVPDPNGCKATVNADQIQFQGPEVIHVSSDSDSDDDVDINAVAAGYVPLAQDPDTADSEGTESGEEEDASSTQPQDQNGAVTTMPEEHAQQIKSVMANIKLPSIPLWARQIPEEQWLASLMNNLKGDTNRPTDQSSHVSPTSGNVAQSNVAAASSSDAGDNNADTFDANFDVHFPTT